MASNIVPGNIDGDYPIAGQDNNSQGMRDNFTATKNNFTQAKTEIENLQSNKANLNATNDFSGNIISNNYEKNIPNYGFIRDAHKGNLIISFNVIFPESLTNKQISDLNNLL